jgi:hypothetical protein
MALTTPIDAQCRHAGWGTPSGELDGVRFKTSILDTLQLVEKAVQMIAPTLARQKDQSARVFLTRLAEAGLVSRPLVRVFADGYETARYGHGAKVFTEDAYLGLIKVATAILQELGYDPTAHGHASTISLTRPSTAATSTSLL